MANTEAYNPLRYSSADDTLSLYAREYPAQTGCEEQLPLLMMHGLTRNSADFEPLIERLGSTRRIIVPDQRGRGLSEYDPNPLNYRPDVYVADMWALLEHLKIDKAILVGTSLGGLMAMLMGAMKPERIAGIILNDIGPVVEQSGLDRIRSYVGGTEPMSDWGEAAEHCRKINESAMSGFSKRDWLEFARRTCEELPDGKVRFAYDSAISQGMAEEEPATVPANLWDLWDALGLIPVLVVRGSTSDILARASVEEMARRHSASFASVDVPGRGHAPILDEPVAVDAIQEFLAKRV